MGNDDHAFIDYDLEFLEDGIKNLSLENKEWMLSYFISCFPETISTLYGRNEYEIKGKCITSNIIQPAACQIFNRSFLKFFFFDSDLGDIPMRRTDHLLCNWYPTYNKLKFPIKSGINIPPVKTYGPLREMVKHFDAYTHVGVPLEICPKMYIPDGFFDNDIKINCYNNTKSKFVNLNPLNKYFRFQDPSGCDEKKVLEDIPIFWKNRISEVIINDNIDKNHLLEARNDYHKQLITVPHSRYYQTNNIGDGVLNLPENIIEMGYRK